MEQVFEEGFVSNYPLTIKHKNGKLIDVLYNASVYKDDNGVVLGVFAAARDITAQKRIEKELMDAKVFAESATEIAEEAKRKAEIAVQIAEDAVRAKQRFLSNMSHEIRTPMNAIIGFTKVVLRTEVTEKQKEYLTAIETSGNALIVLINDILDLAKVDAGKMTFEQAPFKLASSISAMLHLFEPKMEEKNLQLIREYDSRIPQVLVGDAVRLHQIILNLVSNAVKFTAIGKITVRVVLLEEDEEKATIGFSIADTGIGIAENKMQTIFDNFQQATSGNE
ncbi:MAG: histidine kinase dimerization/phospho-acceptor domain-containing protein [Cytophagales bacterium]|nr:histidine kinase dimerization/phospho-acceptor domain-containing protein [Cytophagales bacterium]